MVNKNYSKILNQTSVMLNPNIVRKPPDLLLNKTWKFSWKQHRKFYGCMKSVNVLFLSLKCLFAERSRLPAAFSGILNIVGNLLVSSTAASMIVCCYSNFSLPWLILSSAYIHRLKQEHTNLCCRCNIQVYQKCTERHYRLCWHWEEDECRSNTYRLPKSWVHLLKLTAFKNG